MSFQDKVKRHLAEYKRSQLDISESGCWKRNNKPYAHILPEGKQELNLLQGYRKEILALIEKQHIDLHKDFHHLNSSQATCLNFFYPMIADKQINLLLELLQLDNEIMEEFEFEKVISYKEGTNFDLYLKMESSRQIFFEIKFTENGFGKVTDSPKYRQKYEGIYRNKLAGKIRVDVAQYQTLIAHYQLLRNISYLDETRDDLLIIICPRDNKKVHSEFIYVMNYVVEPVIQDKIRLLTGEELVHGLKDKMQQVENVPSRFRDHYDIFEEKYILG